MESILVRTSAPLRGSIPISSAKNAVLPLMVATLLTSDPVELLSMPGISDVENMKTLLSKVGTKIHKNGSSWALHTPSLSTHQACPKTSATMRASVLMLGAVLARHGMSQISLPGGCDLSNGGRQIDFHVQGLQALGAKIESIGDHIQAQSPKQGLPGGSYTFPKPSLTGTLNLLFAAVLARGTSVLGNVAPEPEIIDVIACLQAMGAKITWGEDARSLHIQGVTSLHGARHHPIPDRIEMGTYMAAVAIAGGELTLLGARPDLLPAVTDILEQCGAVLTWHDQGCTVAMNQPPQAFSCTSAPYPGFPTDLQAPFMALAALSQGTSVITETVWDKRMDHVKQLCRMGANIRLEGNCATITGVPSLMGAHVYPENLRACVAMVLAALGAKGESLIHGAHYLDRGYEAFETRLGACGAVISRLKSAQAA